jgi:hypothetical protein
VPTLIDVTPEMISRAAVALMACEAQQAFTDCYGRTSQSRAEWFARQALDAALDLRLADPA